MEAAQVQADWLVQLAPWAPAAWALLLLFLQGIRATRRRAAPDGAIRLAADSSEQRPLFAVFVNDDDVLEASGFSSSHARRESGNEGEADPAATAEAVLPPPPLAVVLAPLAQALGWSVVILAHAVYDGGAILSASLLAAAAHAFAWGYALARQLARRTPTAPLALLSLYVVLMLDALLAVVQQLRQFSVGPAPLSTLTRLPNLLLTLVLISSIFQMPLNAPLDVAIRFEQAAASSAASTDEVLRPRSPEDANTVLGAFTYAWMSDLMRTAGKRALAPLDVWALSLNNRAEVLSRRFKAIESKTLTRKLLRASARDIAIDATLKLVAVSSEYLRPFFIQKILENLTIAYLADPAPNLSPTSAPSSFLPRLLGRDQQLPPWTPIEKAYLFAFLAFLSALVKTLAQQRHFHYARRIGMRLRSELTIALFEKALRRRDNAGTGDARAEDGQKSASASVGKVISMISDDVNRVLRMGCDSHLIYGAPLEIALGLTFLYNLMGWSALVGVFLLVLSSPINFWIGKWATGIVRQRQTARDARQTSLQELMTDIRAVKLFGWSGAWIRRVEGKREEELKWLLRASFWAYTTIQGQELTVAVAFTALSLFTLIRGPLDQIPGFGIRILQLGVSISRMESFFAEGEVSEHAELPRRRDCKRLRLVGATLRYAGAEGGKNAIEDATIDFPEGRLTVVSGPTGSGKTSILLGLLGELEVVSGSVELPALVSYAAQHPWLESMSIKDNVLFGYSLDEVRYRQVLAACALERDLETLADGDATFVGERGIALSGGQKARLALARAIYAPTRFLLLDDVFSAIDAHTARHLLDRAFTGPLLRDRTVVLVTHHLDVVLPAASYHVELKSGKVVRQGPITPTQPRWGESAGTGDVDATYFLIGYAVISAATASTTLLNELFVVAASMSASRSLFNQLLSRVVHAPLRWFDLVPLGTISNRFTNDVSGIDDEVARTMNMFTSNICRIMTALVVSALVLPASLAFSFLFAVVYISIFRSYLLVNRDANRIASTTASPLFSSFAEALRGVVTIRAFAKQELYRSRLCHIVDETLAFWYLSATLDIWLSIRTQLLSASCLLSTAVFATYFRLSPGLAGIAITSSQTLIQALDVLCNSYGRLVLSMNCLERITEYLEVPQEPAGGQIPPATWPSLAGPAPMLEVRDLVTSYDPALPPVLHGVSFSAVAGERIGIVGRTGSGKTTLATSLLRFVDPLDGSIRIDGEASLFEGTLRENLDPFNEHDDEACLKALERAHLIEDSQHVPPSEQDGTQEAVHIQKDEASDCGTGSISLEARVTAGGTNWSAGQRQLIAMARALLRDARIVVLDESSASLDHDLDARLQQVIRDEFRQSVVLTIAHRLRTVVDYDRILVLDAGVVIEYDAPDVLLAREDGVFRGMWEEQTQSTPSSGLTSR
ncbi:hypothetical protein JCM8202v2_004182 [Rhodotorula sphaerocarpa]